MRGGHSLNNVRVTQDLNQLLPFFGTALDLINKSTHTVFVLRPLCVDAATKLAFIAFYIVSLAAYGGGV